MSPKTQPAQPKIQGADEHETVLDEHIKAGVFSRKGQPAQPIYLTSRTEDVKRYLESNPTATLAEVAKAVGLSGPSAAQYQINKIKRRAHLAPAPRPEDQLKPPVQPTLVEQCRTLAPLLGTLEKIKAEVYSDRKDHFRITAVKQLVDTALSAHPIPQAAPPNAWWGLLKIDGFYFFGSFAETEPTAPAQPDPQEEHKKLLAKVPRGSWKDWEVAQPDTLIREAE